MRLLRPLYKSAARGSQKSSKRVASVDTARAFATQSGDDAVPPTALAKLHLEDGTTLTAKSFGCHKSIEGEVRIYIIYAYIYAFFFFRFLDSRFKFIWFFYGRSVRRIIWFHFGIFMRILETET